MSSLPFFFILLRTIQFCTAKETAKSSPMLLQEFNDIQKYFLIVLLSSLLLTAPAVADVQTITHGKDLMVSCQQAIIALDTPQETPTSSAQNEAFLCMAYLSGVMATAQHANELAKLRYSQASNGRGDQHRFNLYCFDWQLPYQKIARIVLAFGRSKPRYLQRPAHELVIHALQKAFPCR